MNTFVKAALLALVVSCVVATNSTTSLGDGLWRTFNLALVGLAPPLPLTSQQALAAGWKAMSTSCDPNLGIRYAQDGTSPAKNTPLTIYYTASGQVAGLGVNIYGVGAAPSSLVSQGFWIPVAKDEWMLSVSFRPSGNLCNASHNAPEILGTQVVINQGTLNWPVPLTAAEAYCQKWTAGSCMVTMGEHWFYDLATAPEQSWEKSNLLPLVAMYYPPNLNGTLSTIFFTTPVKQPGSDYVLHKPGDWETPALTPDQMCENYCDESCGWSDVEYWSTMHIYLNSQWTYITCPNGEGVIKRECPDLNYGSVSC